MPRIIVQADPTPERAAITVLQERVSPTDLESMHFAGQLLERINWAVGDAKQAELEGVNDAADAARGIERGRFDRKAAKAEAELTNEPALASR